MRSFSLVSFCVYVCWRVLNPGPHAHASKHVWSLNYTLPLSYKFPTNDYNTLVNKNASLDMQTKTEGMAYNSNNDDDDAQEVGFQPSLVGNCPRNQHPVSGSPTGTGPSQWP